MKVNSPKSYGCPVCKSTDNSGQTPYIDIHQPSSNVFQNLSIEFCKSCGFGYSLPEIEDEAVS